MGEVGEGVEGAGDFLVGFVAFAGDEEGVAGAGEGDGKGDGGGAVGVDVDGDGAGSGERLMMKIIQ